MMGFVSFKKLAAFTIIAALLSSASLFAAGSAEAGSKGKKALAIGIGALIVGGIIESELNKDVSDEEYYEAEEEARKDLRDAGFVEDGEEDGEDF